MSRWTVTLTPAGPGAPPECRIRRLPKLALRVCRLLCIRVQAAPNDNDKLNRSYMVDIHINPG